MKYPKDFIYLVDAFKSLPSIGNKSATKITNFLLTQDQKYIKEFITRITNATNNLMVCKFCNCISSNPICDICNSKRLTSLCIVANIDDFQRINDSNMFNGYYHILNINLSKNLDLNKLDLEKISSQIEFLNIHEIIIATSFSIYGELIAEFLKTKLAANHKSISFYRLGFGLPLNADIDYIDDETIRQSFFSKKKI